MLGLAPCSNSSDSKTTDAVFQTSPSATGRRGVPLGELTATQRAAALATVDAVLSDQGYEQVVAILAADDVAGESQNSGGFVKFGSDYFRLAFYGTPSVDSPWTLQFGGHHLAVHVTIGGETPSISPAFTGAEPMTFTRDGKNYAPMAGEQEAVFGLLETLTPTELDAAKINGVAEMVVGPGNDTGFPAPEGLLVSDLAPASQELVRKVIAQWVSDSDPTLSSELLATYESQLAETRIAWSGSTSPDGLNSYFRVDGPRLWIEYTNTGGRGSSVAHAHTVYRDKTLDYGTGPS